MNTCSAVKYRQIEERAAEVARYIVDNNATVRQAAKAFGISKSTIHKDKMDMAEELLRRSRVVVSCGSKVNDDVLSDIALAKRLGIVYTTLDGILKADQK